MKKLLLILTIIFLATACQPVPPSPTLTPTIPPATATATHTPPPSATATSTVTATRTATATITATQTQTKFPTPKVQHFSFYLPFDYQEIKFTYMRNRKIYAILSNGTEVDLLFENVGVFKWAPNGYQAVISMYENNQSNLYFIDFKTEEYDYLLTLEHLWLFDPFWSNDSNQVILSFGEYDRSEDDKPFFNSKSYKIDLGIRMIEDITNYFPESVLYCWNHQENTIIFISNTQNDFEIFSKDILDSSGIQLTNNSVYDVDIKLSPKGNSIAFLREVLIGPGRIQITILDLDTGEEARITDLSNHLYSGKDFEWSPDGEKIIYNFKGEISLYTRSNNFSQVILSYPEDIWDIEWSPDGDVLLLEMGGFYMSDLYIYNLKNGGLSQITFTAEENESDAQWRPHGE